MGQKRSIQEIRKMEASGGSLEPENIGRMKGADNIQGGTNPDNLYESSTNALAENLLAHNLIALSQSSPMG